MTPHEACPDCSHLWGAHDPTGCDECSCGRRACTCGNVIGGDNLCMISACQEEM